MVIGGTTLISFLLLAFVVFLSLIRSTIEMSVWLVDVDSDVDTDVEEWDVCRLEYKLKSNNLN